MSEDLDRVNLSIVLCVMGRLELADYGFRSWMLQELDEPYEVVLLLFNDQRPRFDQLAQGRSANCRLVIKSFERPAYFNISAANNLGIHFAAGRFILFANADVIYPSQTARMIIEELGRREICFAMLSRANLTADQTSQLRAVGEYQRPGAFDGLASLKVTDVWRCANGWIVRSDVVRAIGGFDPRILVAEDVDLTQRVLHYLRRKGLQQCLWGIVDVMGWHLHHPTSELFDAMSRALSIIEPRGRRLQADPSSEEDTIPCRLDSHEALLEDMRKTEKPPALQRYRENVPGKVIRRIKNAWTVLLGRRLT